MEQKGHLRTRTKLIIFDVNWDEETSNEIVIKINLFQNINGSGRKGKGVKLQGEKKGDECVLNNKSSY